MTEPVTQRPNPDELLEKVQREAQKALRGKLKLFFGSSAGVGKTYAMLSSARQLKAQGVDVLIGLIETHGRKETEAMTHGLEHLPLREIPYRDKILKEFDLDGALARKPELILVDELAHSNVQGSRHPKRWQDVEELLAAGIDVYSTVNVQHLETLNDVVSGITGINVWETLPDRVFDAADEVVLVDLPPDELLQRLKEGKVYLPHQAERAIQNFFRKGNLIALRELALRRTADRVDEQMLEYRRDKAVEPVWKARESILACVGAGKGGDKIVRSAARLAASLDVPWHVIYIETPELQSLPSAKRDQILKTLKQAQDMGAETANLSGSDPAEVAVEYAHEHNLTIVLSGRDHPRPWSRWRKSFSERIGILAPDLDVIQVSRTEDQRQRFVKGLRQRQAELMERNWRSYAMAVLACVAVATIAEPLYKIFDLSNIVMLFLMTVVFVALRYGRGPAVLTSFLGVAIFDFLYVPPRFSFAISDVQYLMTFAVMLAVGLIIGQLTAGLKYQVNVATLRETRVRALYEMSRDLSGALLPEQIAEICGRFVESQFGAKASIILPNLEDKLQEPIAATAKPPMIDQGIAQWAFDHEESAGNSTDTLPGSPVLYLPLKAPMRTRGIFAFEPAEGGHWMTPEQRRLLDTFARLIAIAIERIHYVDIAQSTTVKMETERLRNSLLSAISHDLRTPLSALVGLADSMALTKPPPSVQQNEIVIAMREAAMRMTSQVNNLLDMAKLRAGRIQLNQQWHPLEEVIGNALTSISSSMLAHHHVKVSLPDDLPLLKLDAELIQRVLCNLLENVSKYTPAGTEVSITAHEADKEITVIVEDNGPGLPEGKEEEIFKKFERGQKESNMPGVGLGLAICRTIVEAHEGSIRGENLPTGGARFTFTLPKGVPPDIEEAVEI